MEEVTSGVPQGSMLAPVMSLVYVNDMQQGTNDYIRLFAIYAVTEGTKKLGML